MKLNEKQFNYLSKLLVNYDLTKDINNLTVFEASIIIEGILNNGKVKDTYKNIKLSDSDYKRKQIFFEKLVKAKSIYASEKQMNYIRSLCKRNRYEIINEKIIKKDVNDIILLIRDNIENPIAIKYVSKIKEKTEDDLIKLKSEVSKIDIDLPNDWIVYNIQINGIVDFEAK